MTQAGRIHFEIKNPQELKGEMLSGEWEISHDIQTLELGFKMGGVLQIWYDPDLHKIVVESKLT